MRTRYLRGVAVAGLISMAFLAGRASAAPPSDAVKNNVPGFIQKAIDKGPVDPAARISVTVWLDLRNQGQLDQLVQQQHQKGSDNFHKFLTQDQFNASFGPTAQEVKSLTNWLNSHNLTVEAVAENNMYVRANGTVADVSKSFHVQIDTFDLGGQTYRSNRSDPSMGAVGAHVAAVTGLDDYGFQPNHVAGREPDGTPFPMVPVASLAPNGFFFEGHCLFGVQTQTFTGTGVSATYTGNRYGADINNTALGTLPPCGYQPSEMQTAYNMNALYAGGFDGAGETIVIVDAYGSPTIAEDAAVFSAIEACQGVPLG